MVLPPACAVFSMASNTLNRLKVYAWQPTANPPIFAASAIGAAADSLGIPNVRVDKQQRSRTVLAKKGRRMGGHGTRTRATCQNKNSRLSLRGKRVDVLVGTCLAGDEPRAAFPKVHGQPGRVRPNPRIHVGGSRVPRRSVSPGSPGYCARREAPGAAHPISGGWLWYRDSGCFESGRPCEKLRW